ncbi:conserved protein of unknown function [Magnetospirillum sp. XM-1]|uniref:hypothetical protein n=1 Tax=Magnetospirillum sp. XM-1 TaxID=1663591 RepID=UPI00073DBF20|nr:hypothetical protein [Magnetospirillum sp. XM-1]CUW41320.1 conserved protein of unknown function [Magnetospirillum sp. XM-1]
MSRPVILATLLAALSLSAPVLAASGHSHDESGPAAGGLTLDHGRKWQTDAPLRQGMAAIGGDLRAALGPVHDKRYSPREFEALAASIQGHIDTIAQQCKLPEAVDAQLHIVLADLISATDVMKGKGGDRAGGVVSALKALDRYQAHFDHPGWKPVGH